MDAWIAAYLDVQRPAVARMHDYLLGGAHNFAADRAAADRAVAAWPSLPAVARSNRAFLRRAVQFMTSRGIDQFLDLGAGILTAGSVHQTAQATYASARTVYVDVDPIAVAHARIRLCDDPNSAAVLADLRHPEHVLTDPTVRSLIDFRRPVGLLMVAVLHFIHDHDQPPAVIAAYRRSMAVGSYLAISHATRDGQPAACDPDITEAARVYDTTGTGLIFRSHTQVTRLFKGFTLLTPGVVAVPAWHPNAEPACTADTPWPHGLAGVGRLDTATAIPEQTFAARDSSNRPATAPPVAQDRSAATSWWAQVDAAS